MSDTSPISKPTVLVIDDQRAELLKHSSVLKSMLNRNNMDWDIVTAKNMQEAVNILKNPTLNLVAAVVDNGFNVTSEPTSKRIGSSSGSITSYSTDPRAGTPEAEPGAGTLLIRLIRTGRFTAEGKTLNPDTENELMALNLDATSLEQISQGLHAIHLRHRTLPIIYNTASLTEDKKALVRRASIVERDPNRIAFDEVFIPPENDLLEPTNTHTVMCTKNATLIAELIEKQLPAFINATHQLFKEQADKWQNDVGSTMATFIHR